MKSVDKSLKGDHGDDHLTSEVTWDHLEAAD